MMINKKRLSLGFIQAAAVTIYVIIFVFFIISLGESIFSEEPDNRFLSAVVFLLLFVTSACITGSSVLAYPTVLAFLQRVKEAVLLVATTVFWLLLILTTTVLVILQLP